MKKLLLIFSFPIVLFFLSSFTDSHTYILGKWNITAVGTADPNIAKKISKESENGSSDHLKKYLPELSTMMADGYIYQFSMEGKYKILNKDGKDVVAGTYAISNDGETLSLTTNGEVVAYKLTKTTEKHIKLKSKKDSSTFELSKKI